MVVVVKAGKILLSFVYAVFKLFPSQKNKVLFLSRQSNELTLDFKMLKEELEKQKKDIKIVSICNRMDDKKEGMIKFGINIIRSMYHLSTSRVCVLDAYWPAVSLLRHKKSLTVIQMWHALGKIKQSGYQTIGKESGRSQKVSELLCMHRNYDYIIAGGSAWNPFYVASFDTTEDKLVNIGLPRIDYLLNVAEDNRKRAYEKYPEFQEKQVILYTPTFRRGYDLEWEELVDHIDFEKYVLIIKGHPNQKIESDNENVLTCPEFSAVELLASCDYLITDYSAIAVEGAILNKKTYYYLFDYEQYTTKNGLNVDPFDSMPGCAFKDAKELVKDLESGNYKQEVLDEYRRRYLPENLGTSTKKLAQLVISRL